mgnify:CR=1 FL=1
MQLGKQESMVHRNIKGKSNRVKSRCNNNTNMEGAYNSEEFSAFVMNDPSFENLKQ